MIYSKSDIFDTGNARDSLQRLRALDEIRAGILAVEREAEGLLDGLLKGGRE